MATYTDPVCGRPVDGSKAAVEACLLRRDGRTYYFCSLECKRRFVEQAQAEGARAGEDANGAEMSHSTRIGRA